MELKKYFFVTYLGIYADLCEQMYRVISGLLRTTGSPATLTPSKMGEWEVLGL